MSRAQKARARVQSEFAVPTAIVARAVYQFTATIDIDVACNKLEEAPMAAAVVPYLANDKGVEKIYVGVKELMCMGARAPYDHPHVFLDMGGDTQVLCPYCSTLFIHDPRLQPGESDPETAIVERSEAVGSA